MLLFNTSEWYLENALTVNNDIVGYFITAVNKVGIVYNEGIVQVCVRLCHNYNEYEAMNSIAGPMETIIAKKIGVVEEDIAVSVGEKGWFTIQY